MTNRLFILFFSLIAISTLHVIHAVEYTITNRAEMTLGGIWFDKQTMASATNFIWRVFRQKWESDRKNVTHVGAFIDDISVTSSGEYSDKNGIADFIRLKGGYAPAHWVEPGQGDRWDQGYDVTAYFLDYCNGLRKGFVARLNKKRQTFSDEFSVELLGKSVDQLWMEYKIYYEN